MEFSSLSSDLFSQVGKYLLDLSTVMDEESLYEASLRIEPKTASWRGFLWLSVWSAQKQEFYMFIICIRHSRLCPSSICSSTDSLCIFVIINWVEAQRGFISMDIDYLCVLYCRKWYFMVYLFQATKQIVQIELIFCYV